jgi:glycosyltransferase involved in cell wall biosynthesis
VKIAVIHSFYSSRTVSGENVVVNGQIDALRSKGHEVQLFAKYTDIEEKSPTHAIRSAFRVITGFGFNYRKHLELYSPDLILVHNLFPNISTRWLEKISSRRIVFLHNFRPWCSNGFMLREGKSCEKCLRSPIWGSLYRCAGGNFTRSLIQSLGQVLNNYLPRLERSGATIVAVSKSTQEKISTFNNVANVGVLSNFVSPTDRIATFDQTKNTSDPDGFVWAGRISAEKGLRELLEIWPPEYNIDIFGSGPDLSNLAKLHSYKSNITFMGSIPNENFKVVLPNYRGFVNSSTWSEFAPMTIIEALSKGLPIIFPRGLSLGETLSSYNAGAEYVLGDPKTLEHALFQVADPSKYKDYQESVHSLFIEEFSADGWYKKLMLIITHD